MRHSDTSTKVILNINMVKTMPAKRKSLVSDDVEWRLNNLTLRGAMERYKQQAWREAIIEKIEQSDKIMFKCAQQVVRFFTDCVVFANGQPVCYPILDHGLLSTSTFDYDEAQRRITEFIVWVLAAYQKTPRIQVEGPGWQWRSDGEMGLLSLVNETCNGGIETGGVVTARSVGEPVEYADSFLKFLTREFPWVSMAVRDRLWGND